MLETMKWMPHLSITKFDPDQVAWATRHLGLGREPTADELRAIADLSPETFTVESNLLLTAGVTRIVSLLNAGGAQALTATSGRIGVGNSSTAEAVGQTDLQAAAGTSNRWFQALGSCTVSAGVLTAVASFASADGNFAWNEWGLDVSPPTAASSAVVGPCMVNRKVSSMGTKASGSVWTATATITIS